MKNLYLVIMTYSPAQLVWADTEQEAADNAPTARWSDLDGPCAVIALEKIQCFTCKGCGCSAEANPNCIDGYEYTRPDTGEVFNPFLND